MASSGWWRGEGLPLQARLLSLLVNGIMVNVDIVMFIKGKTFFIPVILAGITAAAILAMGLQIPRRVDYGLRTVIYLSVQDPEKCCSIAEIARQQGVPKKFLEKIIQDLMRCGFIKSQRGACGGYSPFSRTDLVLRCYRSD